MTSKAKKIKSQPLFIALISLLIFLLILVAAVIFFYFHYQNHLLPNTYLNQFNLGHLSATEAQAKLAQSLPEPPTNFALTYYDFQLASSAAELQLSYQPAQLIDQLFFDQQQASLTQLIIQGINQLQQPAQHQLGLAYSAPALDQLITAFQDLVDQPGSPAAITLEKSGSAESLVYTPGINGYHLDRQTALTTARQALQQSEPTASVSLNTITHELIPLEEFNLNAAATALVGQKITFNTEEINNFSFSLNDQDLISALDPLTATPDPDRLKELLVPLYDQISRPAVEPVFKYDPTTLQVSEFSPPQSGLVLNLEQVISQISHLYHQINVDPEVAELKTHALDLPLEINQPTTPLSATNNLGINEKIGTGESYYAGSIPGRVHNVALATSKLDNLIIKPGEEFSFNEALGDISAATGYKPAWIISGGRSVMGDGGGVCQVSSTLFRTLLDSGVDITRRVAHAYRVSYYELSNDPGFDATVYSGNVDLRFINDTPGHILISAKADSKNMYMHIDFYGTSDGRSTEITNYTKSGATPAPPAEYIEDPSLAPGQKQQIDWATPGLKTNFTHIVRDKNGQEISRTDYPSNYRAWSAKYLVGPATE